MWNTFSVCLSRSVKSVTEAISLALHKVFNIVLRGITRYLLSKNLGLLWGHIYKIQKFKMMWNTYLPG